MNPHTLAALFFPRLLQCRIMSPGRQCRVQWYKCTNVSDDPCFSNSSSSSNHFTIFTFLNTEMYGKEESQIDATITVY